MFLLRTQISNHSKPLGYLAKALALHLVLFAVLNWSFTSPRTEPTFQPNAGVVSSYLLVSPISAPISAPVTAPITTPDPGPMQPPPSQTALAHSDKSPLSSPMQRHNKIPVAPKLSTNSAGLIEPPSNQNHTANKIAKGVTVESIEAATQNYLKRLPDYNPPSAKHRFSLPIRKKAASTASPKPFKNLPLGEFAQANSGVTPLGRSADGSVQVKLHQTCYNISQTESRESLWTSTPCPNSADPHRQLLQQSLKKFGLSRP